MLRVARFLLSAHVAPFAGAWIEIKSPRYTPFHLLVAPFAGAWIEIFPVRLLPRPTTVAPFAGAWIEISEQTNRLFLGTSLPSRERGLKFDNFDYKTEFDKVAPFAGAWIEMNFKEDNKK